MGIGFFPKERKSRSERWENGGPVSGTTPTKIQRKPGVGFHFKGKLWANQRTGPSFLPKVQPAATKEAFCTSECL